VDIVFLAGIAIFLGTFGGRIFHKLKVPQVVGYIVIGVLLGKSGLGICGQGAVDTFTPLVNFTLGIIGFMIGAELKSDIFKRYGRSIYTILVSEGMLAFLLVTVAVTVATGKLYLGLLLGAVASATDPASTVNVLWEYKTKGPLTTTLTSIVALDDGLALIIYGLVSVFSKAMIAKKSFSFWHSIGTPLVEIVQCVLLGVAVGFILIKVMSRIKEKELLLSLVIGAVAVIVGVSIYLHLDLIFSSMVLGVTVTNVIPVISQKLFKSVKEVSTPLYILFFVIVGATLDIHIFLQVSIAAIIFVYLVARSLGKIIGSILGGLVSKARKAVVKYTGICLMTQGGVAMGLAMSINHNLGYIGEEGRLVGSIVISVMAATTFIVQLAGPLLVKVGVTKADETFRNVTEEDIIESYKVGDIMQRDFSAIRESATLDKIMETIKERESYHFPVVDNHGELVGLISLGSLRSTFSEEQLNRVILAKDVAEPVGIILYQNQPLKEAFEIFEKREIDYLPVVEDSSSRKVVGILEYHPLLEAINRKVLERQKTLDNGGVT
jgi:Kef-type K+ transport system membrane component KefB/CBS domain-containing protein